MPPINNTVNRPLTTTTPSTTTPATTTVATPATTTTTPVTTGLDAAATTTTPGLDATTTHNLGTPSTVGADALRVGIPGLARLTANLQTLPPQPFTLVPGRYPDAVGLPDLLAKLGSSPEGQAAVKQLALKFQGETGIAIPEAALNAAVANPQKLLQLLQITPAQLSAGIDGLNATQQARGHQDAAPTHHLPRRLDFAKLSNVDVKRPEAKLKELAPGLLQGDVKSELPDAQAKTNIAVAEAFTRLSMNSSAAKDAKFTAVYAGKEFTSLDGFIDALRKDGHDVSITFEQRIANFSALHARAPDGTLLDVPAPLMIRTGMKDAAGTEAVVPASHAEVIIRIRKGADTRGPGVDADVKFYQGVSDTGFFPVGLMKEPAWCGRVRSESISGDGAAKAIKLSGALTDIINRSASNAHLAAHGYGVTGVCNDSVAVIQQAMTGKASMYPLMMRDEVLSPEIERRLHDRNHKDDASVKTLKEAITALPSDVTANASAKSRAAASITWEAGKEPFTSTETARAILTAP